MSSPTSRFHLCHDGTTLHMLWIDGHGAPIVLLHGFTGDAGSMLSIAEQLPADRPKLLIDLVGHGRSDAPEALFAYDMASIVDQLLSIFAAYPERHIDLVGYSMGGRIALATAVRAPRFFRSLTLLSAHPGIEDPSSRAERYTLDQHRAEQIESDGVESFMRSWLRLRIFEPLLRGWTTDDFEDEIERRRKASAVGLANSLRATGAGSMTPMWTELGQLDCPVLCLAGELDETYVGIARQTATRAVAGCSGVITGAGHALHLENPEQVARSITQFLESWSRA